VLQDKSAPLRDRANTDQTAFNKDSARTHEASVEQEPSPTVRKIKRQRSRKRQTVPLTIWAERPIAEAMKRLAKDRGLTYSQMGQAAFKAAESS
jgi:hypothetical protein